MFRFVLDADARLCHVPKEEIFMYKFVVLLLLSCLGTIGVSHATVPSVDDRWQSLYQDRFGIRYGIDNDSFDANTFNFSPMLLDLRKDYKDALVDVGRRPKWRNYRNFRSYRAALKSYNARLKDAKRTYLASEKDLYKTRKYVRKLNRCFNHRKCRDRISRS